ncbi:MULTISPECIES: NnrS family protein [unclassified Moraxella]|uniref:NnrS family protein n=1 Tax=unclassified Moraxella TaxID=2685852 RepID=UPI002B400DFD|nr:MULTISPECIES: NnrS family protein [unclassified Moraxella]
MLIDIDHVTKRPSSPHPILNLGFRIFFMGSAMFAVVSMLLWLLILQGFVSFKGELDPFYWHGHEMVFGYSLAVIAGFLLTAVKTWTNQPMPYGWRLFWIFSPWVMARLLWLGLHATPSMAIIFGAFVFDVLFWALTSFWVIKAVWLARQKNQLGIVLKLVLLMFANIAFYWGVLTNHLTTQQLSLHAGLYVIIGVVFTIARRVLPFFIAKGVSVDTYGKPNGLKVEQRNSVLLDRANLLGLVLFMVVDLFLDWPKIASIFALICFVANTLRLKNWYHHGIWHKPLLWSLVIAFGGMTAGLLIFVISPFVDDNLNLHSLGLHGLALFGVGLMTIAMMARVSLGHTARNIHTPPKAVGLMFVLMIVSGACRVFMPMFGGDYMLWILVSQVVWIIAFGLFCVSYAKILSKPRTDKLFG